MIRTKENLSGISSFLIEDKYYIYRHLILQVVILVISVGVFFDAPDRLNTSLNRFYGWISYFLFLNMLVYVNVYVLFPCFLAKNKGFAYVISVVLFTIFALFIMVILQELFYDIAVTHQQPSGIAIFLSIASSMCTIFLFLGGISTLMLFKQWIINNRNANNLRLATFESELNFLKSQINPHFLFNMINNASIMVDEDPKMTSHILEKLDGMLQYQFNDSIQDKVLLKADIAFLSDFLDLEKVRRDHFEYTVAIEGNIGDVEIPPLLFIPFVENAVKHNMDTKSSYVHLKFRMENGCLSFECENSKPLKPVKRDAGGLGLANIKRRLNLLFEKNYVLDVTETETTYTVNLHFNL
ncbi:histidine kinase [Dysgonomonas sp. Marseille-P4677]|uniref:sensor histidine kinase n=1 Tax=Dysgonomonas sp. Marseille-P4677 TaxID=2364790 RepID=UPI001913D044|nr:histidine kinase [Dysgonomonas sp. Marseille-P4677]MBK5721815.1 histidine kinase [Dysgonomonas sp. Marseille-P4677]